MLATIIYYATAKFCNKFIKRGERGPTPFLGLDLFFSLAFDFLMWHNGEMGKRGLAEPTTDGFYHVILRVHNRDCLLGETERDIILGILRRSAEFSIIDIPAFALMSNHIHLLVKINRPREVSDAELAWRLTALNPSNAETIFRNWELWAMKGHADRIVETKSKLRRRMFSLAEFCRTFKNIYAFSYNTRTGHVGTLWTAQYKSVLLKPDYRSLATVAAYIDMNPVRAGIVKTAAQYRWNSIGSARNGDPVSRRNLLSLTQNAYATDTIPSEGFAPDSYEHAMKDYIQKSSAPPK
jgi:REP element-mobilizing transposase RayT